MEKELIEKIGRNKTNEKNFVNDFKVKYEEEGNISDEVWALSFYTYKGSLYIMTGDGMDIPFNDFIEDSKEKIYKSIINEEYK